MKTPTAMLVGRDPRNTSRIGVDLLFPTLEWVTEGIQRAQSNLVSIFGNKYPALTVEDIIVAKLYALKLSHRFKDLDDLEQIFISNHPINLSYLCGKMEQHQIAVPKELRQKIQIDRELGRVSREIERRLKLAEKVFV